MIKIVIIDDHPIVRRGLKQILMEESDLEIVGEAENAEKAMPLLRQSGCDIVILDITLPGVNGIGVLAKIKGEFPGLPVLILSVHPEEQYAKVALKTGASGYLTKEGTPDELVKAIRKIVSGGRYISPALAEELAFNLDREEGPLYHSLSNREFQVMVMIASGKKTRDIASMLNLSVKTISTYRTRILEKTKMRSNSELIHYAIRNGLV